MNKLKKVLAVSLAGVSVLSIASCGGGGGSLKDKYGNEIPVLSLCGMRFYYLAVTLAGLAFFSL